MSEPIDLSRVTLGLKRDGTANLLPTRAGLPPRVDGYTVSAPHMTRNPPHNGEMHPDGDEVIFLISGRIDIELEVNGAATLSEVFPGQALVVPRGTWHRLLLREPSQILHITPGPRGEWRPINI